jgi:hypothetical protein
MESWKRQKGELKKKKREIIWWGQQVMIGAPSYNVHEAANK